MVPQVSPDGGLLQSSTVADSVRACRLEGRSSVSSAGCLQASDCLFPGMPAVDNKRSCAVERSCAQCVKALVENLPWAH